MARQLPEWIGETDDTPVPARVKLRVLVKYHGRCPICTRRLRTGHWTCDHIQALINGGENRERNLQPICDDPCNKIKTGGDVAEKSRTYEIASKHFGAKRDDRTITAWRLFNGNIRRVSRQR